MRIRTKAATKVCAILLIVVMILPLAVTGMSEIQWSGSIVSFEQYDPVYSAAVELGTAESGLSLPETLRAIVDIPEQMDVNTFVQAEPKSDTTDGTESFDYYWYGYVAPKNAEEIYAGAKAGHTEDCALNQADKAAEAEDKSTEIPTESLGDPGKEGTEEAPVIEEEKEVAAEAEEQVECTCGFEEAAARKVIYSIYYADPDDKEKVGEVGYRVYGSIEGSENVWFTCDEAGNITGVVLDIPVTWSGNYDGNTAGEYTFTASVSTESIYKWSGKAPTATIIVQESPAEEETEKDEVEKEEAEKEKAEKTEEDANNIECTCKVGKNEYSSEHAEDCPYYDGEKLLCNCDQKTNEKNSLHAKDCPCYIEAACACGAGYNEYGVIVHSKDCPKYIGECHCGSDGEDISAENYPWQHQEDCPYFSPVECMCKVWEEMPIEVYDETTESTIVENVMLPAEYSHVHDGDNENCPLYEKSTVKIKKLSSGDESVMALEDARRIVEAQEKGEILYPSLGEIEILEDTIQEVKNPNSNISMLSARAVDNDTTMNTFMETTAPTSGNPSKHWDFPAANSPTTPGTWIDYVNTIWRNKAYNKFAWTADEDTGAHQGWKWSGKSASQNDGSVETNPLKIPTKSGNTWKVYSGEQLRYALEHFVSNDVIMLMSNINLNGKEYPWKAIRAGNKSLTLDGNNHVIYNMGIYSERYATNGNSRYDGHFLANNSNTATTNTVKNLTFTTMKNVGVADFNSSPSIFNFQGSKTDITNVNCRDSMIYQVDKSSTGMEAWGTVFLEGNNGGTIKGCILSGNYLYCYSHANPMGCQLNNINVTNISNCAVVDTLIASIGVHSAGFLGCLGGHKIQTQECFTSVEMYGSYVVAGFKGFNCSIVKNCFATGSLEGYSQLAGFAWNSVACPIENCYTTMLVGLRSNPTYQAGFITPEALKKGFEEMATIKNCYAAGEVGNYDTDLVDNSTHQGGFTTQIDAQPTTWTNCYYDKQTTAMREWTDGNRREVNGVRGVLTSSTSKGGTGLASGTYGGADDKGFRGFSNNAEWVFTEEHYPQLAAFTNANSSGWISEEAANMAKAYSKASTATVFLDTWDNGYDWNTYGVRTSSKVSYDRAGGFSHKGGSNTYDTVREIISPFEVTNTSWTEMVSGGLNVSDQEGITKDTIKISNGKGKVNNPGMNWYQVSESVEGQTGYRPLRLIAYMMVDAGEDKDVEAGTLYNHREDVRMSMMDTITDNLVLGLDDDEVWSTYKSAGYPTKSNTDDSFTDQYYRAATDHENHLLTNFSASQGAWVNTEVWRAKKNQDGTYPLDKDGNYIQDYSVKVTGVGTGQNATIDEKKWNGVVPIYPDIISGQKYIISYYWQLEDGRYVTDSKVVTITPGKQTLTTNVYNADDNSKNGSAMKLNNAVDSGADTNYRIPSSPAQTTTLKDIPYGDNVTAAWSKVRNDTTVKKITLTLTDRQGNGMGTQTVSGEDLVEGTQITIPTFYYYLTTEQDSIQGQREVTKTDTVNVTYSVEKDADGNYYLRFNKLNNPAGIPGAGEGTSDGIPAGTEAYINELSYNTKIDLYVEVFINQTANIQVKKVVSNYATDMEEQPFIISLTEGVDAQLTLKNGETSKPITTDAAGSRTFDISEIVPMEYDLTDIQIKNNGSGTAPAMELIRDDEGRITGGTITIYPDNEVLITVTNKFNHEGYFKDRVNVENVFTK